MPYLLLLASVFLAAVGLLWRYFKQLVLKSPLDNIPGPLSESFLYGKNLAHLGLRLLLNSDPSAGNLRQLISPQYGWGFVHHITDSYPGIASLRGPLGVSIAFLVQNRNFEPST